MKKKSKKKSSSSAPRGTREAEGMDVDRIDGNASEEAMRRSEKKSKKSSKKSSKRSADLSLDLVDPPGGLSDVALSDAEMEPMVLRRRAAVLAGTHVGAGIDRPSSGGVAKDVWAINRSSASSLRRSADDSDRPKDSPTTRAQRDVMESLSMDGLALGEGRGGAPALSRRFMEPLLQQRRGKGEAAGGEDYDDEEEEDGDSGGMKMARRDRNPAAEAAMGSTSYQPTSSVSTGAVGGADSHASNGLLRTSRDAPPSASVTAAVNTATTTSSSSSLSTGAEGRKPPAAPVSAAENGEQDISEIDKRIRALQSFLDKAR
jgi:hypothetical protein